MDLELSFENLKESFKTKDPKQVLREMLNFFEELYNSKLEQRSLLLSFYSSCQQFETIGLNANIIKQAIVAHVTGEYSENNENWEKCARSLNALLIGDGLTHLRIGTKDRPWQR